MRPRGWSGTWSCPLRPDRGHGADRVRADRGGHRGGAQAAVRGRDPGPGADISVLVPVPVPGSRRTRKPSRFLGSLRRRWITGSRRRLRPPAGRWLPAALRARASPAAQEPRDRVRCPREHGAGQPDRSPGPRADRGEHLPRPQWPGGGTAAYSDWPSHRPALAAGRTVPRTGRFTHCTRTSSGPATPRPPSSTRWTASVTAGRSPPAGLGHPARQDDLHAFRLISPSS